jgi:O-antigen ligase
MTAALAFSYGLGTCISVFDGLISGPGPDGRTVGLTTHPNALGISCLLTLALLRYTGHVLPRLRPALWVVGIIATYGIWLSGSRGALAAAAFLALVVTIAERSVAGTLGLGVAFAGLLVTVGYVNNSRSNNALARILGGGTSSDASGQRHKAFETALSQINDHPLFGAGFVHIREAQSVLLQVPAALGLIALLGFLAILVSLMLPLVTRPAPLRYLAYPTIAYLALAVTTDSVSDTVVWGPLSLCMIAAVRVANRSPDDTTPAAVPIGDQIRPSEAR